MKQEAITELSCTRPDTVRPYTLDPFDKIKELYTTHICSFVSAIVCPLPVYSKNRSGRHQNKGKKGEKGGERELETKK